ncbi:hypothetical protein ACI6Q2_13615 [Chitinophagaceae bacterium LWZ2-11]
MKANILNLRDYSLSYRYTSQPNLIQRENLISEIEDIAENGTKLIIVEGSEGIGKTSILLQFSEKHNQNCFTYFINPASKITYQLDYLMEDIGKQMSFYLNNEEPPSDIIIEETNFNSLAFSLIRSQNKKHPKIYFAIDGLDQIESSDAEALISTLSILPFNTKNFHFIISGEIGNLLKILPQKTTKDYKPLRVPRFTVDEVSTFFGWQKNNEYAREITNTWKGNPEILSQVKRILDNGVSIEDFIQRSDIKEKNDLLDIEWEQSGLQSLDFNHTLVKAICLITFDNSIRKFQDLLSILQEDYQTLKNQISKISFLSLKDDTISFVSLSYRTFAASKLKKFEHLTNSLLINYYTDKSDANSLTNLPSLLNNNREFSKVIDTLNIDNLKIILDSSNSFGEIKKQLNIGYKASNQLNKAYQEIFRFSLYRSTILGLQVGDLRVSELKAYVSLDKYDEAFSLINKAYVKEEKLSMLILYAKELKLKQKPLEDLYIEEIKALLEDADSGYIKENLMGLVTDLAFINPEISINTLKKHSGLKNSDSIEWLIGYISAISNLTNHPTNAEGIKLENTTGKEKENSFLFDFSNSIGIALNGVPASQIILEVQKIDRISDRLFQLKSWMLKNPEADKIHEIIDYALNLILSYSSDIKPTTTTLLDIVEPIINVKNYHFLLNLSEKIYNLLETVNTPTIDKFKIEFILIQSFFPFNQKEGNQRAFDVFNNAYKIPDFVVKIEILSHAWELIKKIEKSNDQSTEEFLFKEDEVKKEIENELDIFFTQIGDQFTLIKDVLQVIAGIDIKFALSIANRLNIQDRRMMAKTHCLLCYYKKLNIADWDFNIITMVFHELIKDTKFLTKVVYELIDAFFTNKRTLTNGNKQNFSKILKFINNIEGFPVKCTLLSKSISILSTPNSSNNINLKYNDLVETLKSHLLNFWQNIGNPIIKINTGYNITYRLAEIDKATSVEYLQQVSNINAELNVNTERFTAILREAISVIIKIYAGLLKKDNTTDYKQIEKYIKLLPSPEDQLMLWAELGVRSYFANNQQILDQLVKEKIIPILEKNQSDKFYYYYLIKIAASSLYLSQLDYFLLLKAKLPDAVVDDTLSSIFFVLLTNRFDNDEFSGNYGSKDFTYQRAMNYIKLLKEIQNDYIFFYHFKNLANLFNDYPHIVTREQKKNIKTILEGIITSKLPNKKNGIQHDGYLILAKAYLNSFELIPTNNESLFELLEKETENVPNTSDRSFIYSKLAAECPIKKRKIDLINKAFSEANKINSLAERVNCFEDIAYEAERVSPALLQEHMTNIQSELYKLDEADAIPSFRKFIDLVYKCDKNLAQRVVSTMDTDPARSKVVEPINDYYEELEQESLVLNDYSQFGKIKDRRKMGKLSKRLLGQLNSQKRAPRSFDKTITLLHTASRVHFLKALPLFDFFLENAFQDDETDRAILKSFYDSSIYNTILCYHFICKLVNKPNTSSFIDSSNGNTFVVNIGARNEALSFIRKHAQNNGSKDICIIDPYFSSKDVYFIKDILTWCPQADITVLTSILADEITRDATIAKWKNISDEELNNLKVIKVWTQKNQTPFHDRWVIFMDKGKGLRIGTSINSLGNKISEISYIQSQEEFDKIVNAVVVPYVKQKITDNNEEKIKYEIFDM